MQPHRVVLSPFGTGPVHSRCLLGVGMAQNGPEPSFHGDRVGKGGKWSAFSEQLENPRDKTLECSCKLGLAPSPPPPLLYQIVITTLRGWHWEFQLLPRFHGR